MEIFSAKDCISFIKKNIEDHGGVFGYKAKLAETMGIQRSYLSNILTEKAYPTMEQAEKLTRFWKMSKLETDFFINLLSRDKAGTIELKQLYNQRLNELKKSRLDLSQRFQKNNISTEAQLKYYSSWLYSAIDVLVTIPDYNDVAKISKRLSISTEVAHKVLLDLENIGLVKNEKNKWHSKNMNIHIGADSPFNALNHNNWRQRAVLSSSLSNYNNDSVHYTAVYSLSLDDVEKIKSLTLSLVDQTRSIVTKSKEEELFCFNCDFFKVN